MRSVCLFICVFAFSSFQAKSLRVVSWNIKFLPRQLNFFVKHSPLKRCDLIADVVKNDSIDIICFQEAFDYKANRKLKEKLSESFPFIVGPANDVKKKFGFKLNSGVIFYSKFPIVELGAVEFKDCEGENCAAAKGGLLIEADVEGEKVQLLGTHMDAGKKEATKIGQLFQLRTLLERFERPEVPQIICGDFNIHRTDRSLFNFLKEILKVKGYEEEEIKPESYTYDPNDNDMSSHGGKGNIIDFIFYKDNGRKAELRQKVKRYKQKWGAKHKDLSDHFAVWMEVRFKNKEEEKKGNEKR